MLKKLASVILFLAALALLIVLVLGALEPPEKPDEPRYSGPPVLRIAIGAATAGLPVRALNRLPELTDLKLQVDPFDPDQDWLRMAAGELDLALVSLDQFALAASRFDPGVIVFPAGLSQGNHQILLQPSEKKQLWLAYVEGTASEYLAFTKARSDAKLHFELVGAERPEQALEWFTKGEVQALSLWQPWTERNKTDSARQFAASSPNEPLTFVWVASRQLLDGRSEPRAKANQMEQFAAAWFGLVGQLYRGEGLIQSAIAEENELNRAELESHLRGFQFFTLDQATGWAEEPEELERALQDSLRVWSLGGAANIQKTNYEGSYQLEMLLSLGGVPEAMAPTELPPTGTPGSPSALEVGMMSGYDSARTAVFPTQALREQNQIEWRVAAGDDVRGRPVLEGERLFYGCDDGYFYCTRLDRSLLWRFHVSEKVQTGAALAGDAVYFGANDGSLYALDKEQGKKKWAFSTNDQVLSDPTIVDGRLLFTSLDGHLYCLNAKNGGLLWKYDAGAGLSASVSVLDGQVYAGDLDGNLHCLTQEGKAVWKAQTGGPIAASSPTDGSAVYAVTRRGTVHSFKTADGQENWKTSLPGAIESSPALAGQVLVFGCKDTKVYGFNASDGKKMWEHKTRGAVTTSPAVADGVAYLGGEDGRLYALDVQSGRRLWRFKIPKGWVYSPLIWDGYVYFGTSNRSVFKLH